MARIRTIKPDFWTSEQIVECSPIARLLFVGLWNFVDDGGAMPLSPRRIKMQIFPGDDFDLSTLCGWLAELRTAGLIATYRAAGGRFLAVTGWKHQRIERPTIAHPQAGDPGSVPDDDPISPDDRRTIVEHSPNDRRAVDDHSTPEGNGREGNKTKPSARRIARPSPMPETPDGVDPDAWAKWDAYRKAKSGKAWTDEARRLSAGKLRAFGADALAVVEQSVANGWSGLFPIKPATPVLQKRPDGPGALAWVTSERGTIAKGKELGLEPRPGEIMEAFRDRVVKASAEQQRAAP